MQLIAKIRALTLAAYVLLVLSNYGLSASAADFPIILGPAFDWTVQEPLTGTPGSNSIVIYMTFAGGQIFVSSTEMGDSIDQLSAIINQQGGDACSRINRKFQTINKMSESAKICTKMSRDNDLMLFDVSVSKKIRTDYTKGMLHDFYQDTEIKFSMRFDGQSCVVNPTFATTWARAKELKPFELKAIKFTRSACRCNIDLHASGRSDEEFGTSCGLEKKK